VTNLAFVIDPGDPELDHPLGLDEVRLFHSILLVTLDDRTDRFEHFSYCLKELRLIRIALLNNFETCCTRPIRVLFLQLFDLGQKKQRRAMEGSNL